MKKFFFVLAILALVFAACEEEKKEKEQGQTVTQLTIKNESRANIQFLKWNNYAHYGAVLMGESISSTVQSGTGYIYFEKYTGTPHDSSYYSEKWRKARTSSAVYIEEGEELVFIFTDNTIVVNLETNNTERFDDLKEK